MSEGGPTIFESIKARLDRIAPAAQSLWLIPSLTMIVAMGAASLLGSGDPSVSGPLEAIIYSGDPSAARDIISITAGAVASIVTLTLTLTVVALQLVSSQFSPRILREYLSDRTSKAVVSLLLGTFSFALVTLLFITDPGETTQGDVPEVSMTVLVMLAILSLIGLVLFIHNLTQSLRIENIIDGITAGALKTIEGRTERSGEADPEGVSVPSDAHPIQSKRDGYIVDYDIEGLVRRLSGLGVNMATVPAVGEHVAAGAVAAWVWGIEGEIEHDLLAEIRDALNSSSTIGPNRSVATDAAFGVRQLADIAVRALSPGINDPTTATAALDRIATLLHRMLEVGYAEGHVYRGDGCVVQVARIDFEAVLDVGFRQPIIYGASDPMVVREILRILGDLGYAGATEAQRDAVRRQIGLVSEVAGAQALHESLRREIEDLRAEALAVINGEPRIPLHRTI